jgi:DNA-binding beta-propeller fold protein YncE
MQRLSILLPATLVAILASSAAAQSAPGASGPYKVIKSAKVGGAGNFDYVYADTDGRRLYIPRQAPASKVTVFNLDTLESAGEIAGASARGVAVDPKTHHGFCSSKPVVMWDTQTLATIKTIPVDGGPDGILFEPLTERIYVLSHSAPNVTLIDAKDGSIVGTIDLGGAPEQAVSDGKGKVFIDLEDKDQIAVVDANTMKVLTKYDLGGKGGAPAGLAMDIKNHVLFSACANPATFVILNADDGKIITALPIGNGTDGATFNASTMEAFSSNRDGTLTVVKEKSPTEFEVEQNVKTMPGAKTLTLDSKTNQILLITAEYGAPASQPAAQGQAGGQGRRGGRGRAPMLPDSFTILVVGK